MAWLISITLLFLYLLGLFVFNAGRGVHVLPVLAVLVLVIDYFVTRQFRKL